MIKNRNSQREEHREASKGIRQNNWHSLEQVDNTEFPLQNSNDLSFEVEQVTSFCCDQRACVDLFTVLSIQPEQGVDVRRCDLKSLDLGYSSARNFVDLET